MRIAVVAVLCLWAVHASAEGGKRLLFGDTHLHTCYSFDAFLNGNQGADPDTAYRYAKGLPVIHPGNRTRVRIGTPLDFLVVSDHAEFLGGIRDIYQEGVQDQDAGFLRRLAYRYYASRIRRAIDGGTGQAYFRGLLPTSEDPSEAAKRWAPTAATPPGADVSRKSAWDATTRAADAHDEPGRFSALIGWEWSSTPGGANLHRIVVTDADGETARRFLPFGSDASPFPEDLWAWLARISPTRRSLPTTSSPTSSATPTTSSSRPSPTGRSPATSCARRSAAASPSRRGWASTRTSSA